MYNYNNNGYNQYTSPYGNQSYGQQIAQQVQNPYQQPQTQQQQMYNQQPQVQQEVVQNTLNGRIVSSIDEVRALPLDLTGRVDYYPSSSGKSIYTKSMMLDGSANIKEYVILDIEKDKSMEERLSKLELTVSELNKELGGENDVK